VYVGDIPYLTASGWAVAPTKNSVAQAATDGQSSYLYEKACAALWNDRIKTTCNTLKAEGLNVNHVAMSSVINMVGASGDFVHLADPQHYAAAQKHLSVINA
jgi:hypothetical protein